MNEASTGNYPALHTIFIIFEGGNELTIVSRKDYGENNTSCRGTYNIEFSTKLNHLAWDRQHIAWTITAFKSALNTIMQNNCILLLFIRTYTQAPYLDGNKGTERGI